MIKLMEMDRFFDVNKVETMLEFSEFGNISCFLFCESGRVSVLLGDRIYKLERNAVCIIPPYSSIKFIERSDDLKGWVTKMDMKDITDAVLGLPIDTKIDIGKYSCRYVTESGRKRILDIKKVIDDRLYALEEEGYNVVNNVIRSLRKAFCYEIIQAYITGTEADELPVDRKQEIFNAFLASAKMRFASQKSVCKYAEEQNLSPAYLSSVIKEVSGRSAKDWIENLGFAYAVHYLRNPNYPVKEIAWLLNFPDQSAFGKFFKNISGLSPFQFRKKYL